MTNFSRNINSDVGVDSSNPHGMFLSISSICLLIIEVLGVLCNGIILTIYYKYSRLRTATNLFILNLALCNLLLALLEIILSAPSSFKREWMYGTAGCITYGFGHHYIMSVAVCTLSIIAFDRFCVITKPVRNLRTFVVTKSYARALILVVHVYAFVFTFPMLVGWNELVPDESFQTGCYIDYADQRPAPLAYTVISTIFTCIFPLVLTSCCYARIYRSVRNSSKRSTLNRKKQFTTRGEIPPNKTNARRKSLTHTRTARMIVVVMFFFLLTWLPSKVTGLCLAFGVSVPALAVYISAFFAKSCVMYNAVVYVFLNHRFRAAFLHLTFFCRDDNRLRLTTSATNQSGRFGDLAPSVVEQGQNRTRILSRKNLSQLSILPITAIPEVSSTSGKDSTSLDGPRPGWRASQIVRENSVSGEQVASTRLLRRNESYINNALEDEGNEIETTNGGSRAERTPGVEQDTPENNCGSGIRGWSCRGEGSDVVSGAFCQENNMVLNNEGMDVGNFLELDVNSLGKTGCV